jgi:hypothetical protein
LGISPSSDAFGETPKAADEDVRAPNAQKAFALFRVLASLSLGVNNPHLCSGFNAKTQRKVTTSLR